MKRRYVPVANVARCGQMEGRDMAGGAQGVMGRWTGLDEEVDEAGVAYAFGTRLSETRKRVTLRPPPFRGVIDPLFAGSNTS